MNNIIELKDCFDAASASNDQSILRLSEQKQEILQIIRMVEENDRYYGTNTLVIDNKTPLVQYMKNLSKTMNDVVLALDKTISSVQFALWTKRKNDLDSFISYCDTKIQVLSGENNYQFNNGFQSNTNGIPNSVKQIDNIVNPSVNTNQSMGFTTLDEVTLNRLKTERVQAIEERKLAINKLQVLQHM